MESKFNERLKELRIDKGLLQGELAQKLGVTKSAVSGWETGRNQPSYEMLITISEFFAVTVDYLIGKSEY